MAQDPVFPQRPISDFFCWTPDCPEYGIRGSPALRFWGWSGHSKRIRLVHCTVCGHRYSERKGTPLEGSQLPDPKAKAVFDHLRERCGTRPTSRLVGVAKDTVTRLVRKAGRHAERAHDELVAHSPPDRRGPARRAP
jgi:LacI family transcriptional regulator